MSPNTQPSFLLFLFSLIFCLFFRLVISSLAIAIRKSAHRVHLATSPPPPVCSIFFMSSHRISYVLIQPYSFLHLLLLLLYLLHLNFAQHFFALLGAGRRSWAVWQPIHWHNSSYTHTRTNAHTVILTYLVCSRLYNSAQHERREQWRRPPNWIPSAPPFVSALGCTLFILLRCVVAFYLFFPFFFWVVHPIPHLATTTVLRLTVHTNNLRHAKAKS